MAASLGLDKVMVESALVGWVQNGRVMYDLEEGVYRKRELTREPLAMEHLRFVNEREQRAAVLLHRAQVAIESVDTTEAGTTVKARLQDGKKVYAVELAFDVERRIKAAECGCDYYIQNRLHRGPCEHMLALRAAQERGISDRSVGPVNVVRGRRVDAPSKSARADAAVAPAGFDVAPESGSSTAPGRFPWQRDLALSVRTTFLPFDADTALIARVGDMTAAPGMPSAANPDLMCVLTLRTGNARRKFASIPDSRERRDDDPLAILAIGNAVDDFVRSQGAQWERGDVVAFIRSDLTARDCVDWTLRLGIVPWVLAPQGFHRVGRRSATQPAPFDAAGTPSPTAGEPASKPTLWRRIASVFKRGGSAEAAAATQGEPEVEGEPIIALLRAMRPQVPEDFDRVLRLSRLLQRCRTMSQSDRHAQLAASLQQDEIVRRAFSDQELISLLRRYIP